jgi:NDP-sugar pyrophosphorylase family protein
MKAVLLAGGFGTRLRPLTIDTPKPIVPVFDRPLLRYQIEQLKQLPEIDEVILSLNYQPKAIEEVFGNGSEIGIRINYMVEPSPLGTGGAVKFAAGNLKDTILVFNGDVLTNTDLREVIELHRSRSAKATIVLTPVDNPSAYGLVETAPDGNVSRFLEKPSDDQITCNTINAGIYVLEPVTFDRIPDETNWSIERKYFPSLVESGDTFVAYIDHGYWIDIGTPEKYLQLHRDIMTGTCKAYPFRDVATGHPHIAPSATVSSDARLEGTCFIAARVEVDEKATIGSYSVIGTATRVGSGAVIDGAIVWSGTTIGANATVRDAIVGHNVTVGDHAVIGPGAVIGDNSVISPYTRIG